MPTMQHIIPKRMVVYAKDIENITGRKERTARKLLQKIREKFGKQKGDFITVEEFCEFTGLKKDTVQEYLLN